MTFYYPKELYDATARWHIFPLLKSLLKEKECRFETLSIVGELELADYVIIPMSWNYYHTHNTVPAVLDYCKHLPSHTLIISFVFGDLGVNVPKAFRGLVYRNSGRRSKLPSQHFGMPIFVEDPIQKFYSQQEVVKRPYTSEPTVGFCGQARNYGFHSLKELLKVGYRNMLSDIGYSKKGKEQLISTTYLRWQLLSYLKQSPGITSNFIIRSMYRAGVTEQKDMHPTTMEFYDNIKNSDYVLCVRGAGNFSTRLYETLAMGRIPVFVNTDCLLPLDDIIYWSDHVVWVDYHERHLIAEKVKAFHSKHNESSLNELFIKNRHLWKSHLQLFSFFKTSFNAHKETTFRN